MWWRALVIGGADAFIVGRLGRFCIPQLLHQDWRPESHSHARLISRRVSFCPWDSGHPTCRNVWVSFGFRCLTRLTPTGAGAPRSAMPGTPLPPLAPLPAALLFAVVGGPPPRAIDAWREDSPGLVSQRHHLPARWPPGRRHQAGRIRDEGLRRLQASRHVHASLPSSLRFSCGPVLPPASLETRSMSSCRPRSTTLSLWPGVRPPCPERAPPLTRVMSPLIQEGGSAGVAASARVVPGPQRRSSSPPPAACRVSPAGVRGLAGHEALQPRHLLGPERAADRVVGRDGRRLRGRSGWLGGAGGGGGGASRLTSEASSCPASAAGCAVERSSIEFRLSLRCDVPGTSRGRHSRQQPPSP